MKTYLEEIKDLNEVVTEALSEVLTDGTIEEIESKRRDGFIPASHNHGGYSKRETLYLQNLYSSGQRFGDEKADEKIEYLIKYSLDSALEQFKSEYKEELEGIDPEQINYHDLYTLKKGKLAESLSEIENASMDEDTIIREIRVMYHGQDEEGTHSMTIDAAINWESPYHRPGSNNESIKEVEIEFKDAKELKVKLTKALKEMDDFVSL